LKWNDFEKNVSKSFSQLRQQTGLFDVTLVSRDQKQVSAHRLVLSACSEFFKTIFHSNTHSHPLLYLDGVDHGEINLMLDYIYQGEVQIYQEYLDRFLNIANKFKLDGLLATEENTMDMKSSESMEGINQGLSEYKTEEQIEGGHDFIVTPQEQNPPPKKVVRERSLKVVNQSFDANNSEVDSKFEELVVKENNTYRCTVCEKTMSHKTNMKKHLETHLTGLSYDCQLCGKTFRFRNSLDKHTYTVHKR